MAVRIPIFLRSIDVTGIVRGFEAGKSIEVDARGTFYRS
jgi:hypothetical protein